MEVHESLENGRLTCATIAQNKFLQIYHSCGGDSANLLPASSSLKNTPSQCEGFIKQCQIDS